MSGADQEFVEAHRQLVISIANKVRLQLNLTCDLDDLIAFGYQGLLEANERFDPTRGVKFNTFAYYRIRGAVIDGVRSMAYLPRRAYAQIRAAEAADQALEQGGEARAQNPGQRDTAEAVRDMDDALGKLTASFVIASLGQSEEEDAPDTPEEQLEREQLKTRVRTALSSLPERELKLVEGFYLQGRRFDEVAAELGISKSWASRLHTKALGLMRDALAGEYG